MKNISKLKLYYQVAQNMGYRYIVFRLKHEFEKRTGQLKRRHPTNPPLKQLVSLEAWKKDTPKFFFQSRNDLSFSKKWSDELVDRLERIISGKTQFFFDEWLDLGKNYDWVTHPITAFRFDINSHWSQIEDFSIHQGDIKYIWEKSRFTFLLDIIRHDYHVEKDNSQFVFAQIEDWIDKNPINQGPNWKCSQEISIRTFNWTFALYFYKDSSALTLELWNKIIHVIYWSLHHVYHHIDFSRIAVRNNHAITETLFLALSELLFPFIAETKIWAKDGRKWFEEEISYQIYEDGTYLQFSMNYHRVVIQLLSLGISLAEIHGNPFSKSVYVRAYKSVNFLYQCQNEKDGWLPNYGANDGALFFPFSTQDFRDYRPQLSCLYSIICKSELYDQEELEEKYWMKSLRNNVQYKFEPINKKFGIHRYDVGGFYLISELNSLTFLRCGSHKDRPQQADNHHLDLWVNGNNILKDSGSYRYNAPEELSPFFVGTLGHNTVSLNRENQMLKGSRFIWFFWTQRISFNVEENDEYYLLKGEISAFRHLKRDIIHRRTVKKWKNEVKWEIEDEIFNAPDNSTLYQFWHGLDSEYYEIMEFDKDGRQIPGIGFQSFLSNYYGSFKRQNAIEFCSSEKFLKTNIIQREK